MTLQELELYGRAIVPGASKRKITQTLMRIILNNGASDIAHKTECIYASGDFSSTANTDSYSLTANLTRYLTPAKEGLWWNNGSKWDQLEPVTAQYMKLHHPNWMSDSAGDSIQRYWIEQDTLYIHPKLSIGGSDDLRLFFYQGPVPMTQSSHYPFGETVEIARLKLLHETLIKYWKWKAYEILGKDKEAKKNEALYENEVLKNKRILAIRKDLVAGSYDLLTRMRGPNVN